MAVPAGRGSGKTELAKRRLVRFLPVRKAWSDPRYFYAAPTEAQARMIAWDHLLRLTPKSWLRGDPNVSNMRIFTKFGSELRVVGMDKPERIEGVQWDGGVLDESCDLKPKVFDKNILPALTHRNGWCWRIGVPKRQGLAAPEFRRFFEEAVREDLPDRAGFTWPSSDILTPDQLQYAMRHMEARDYAEQFNAIWQESGGGVFYAFNREANVRPCGYDHNMPLIIGSDFNVDPMAWAIGHYYGSHMEWHDEIYLSNANTPLALDVLYSRYQHHHGGFQFYGDATGRHRKSSASYSDYQLIMGDERFAKMGREVDYPMSNPSRIDRFAVCNAVMRNAAGEIRMFIDPRCARLIDDLEARSYYPGTRDVNDPIGVGHISDAMGYAVCRLFGIDALPGTGSEIMIRTAV